MKANRRTLFLGVALAGTLIAVAWVSGTEEDVVVPVERQDAGAARRVRGSGDSGQALPELRLAALDGRGFGDLKTDLFAAKSWYVPPPRKPAAPRKPTAPPVPFAYIGRMIEGDSVAVFVSQGVQNRTLRVGDVINHVWRVDAIEATRMKFTYLPLDETKYLTLGAGS
jgi:hypothetical protein